jgi:predicted GNAT family N-acyltransferase
MRRVIIGYRRDEEGHWVGELDCGHRQHLRHDPPWQERPWVIHEAGRVEHLGTALDCRACDKRAFSVREARWAQDERMLRALRLEVFVQEQGIPEALEWDGCDAACRHVLAQTDAGEAIGSARLAEDGRIGRMAVRPLWRGQGVGRALIAQCLSLARCMGLARVHLHAQVSATLFYARYGFAASGPPFSEAGIPHLAMTLALDSMNWTEARCQTRTTTA